MAWVSLNNLTRFYTKLKEKFYLKTEIDTKVNTLNTAISNISTVYYGDGVDSAIAPLNADQLQGHPASYFTTSEELNNIITNGTLKMDLLWENASPTSSFAEQTISVNYSSYKLIMVVFMRDIFSDILCHVLSPTTPQKPTATMYAWNASTILYRYLAIKDNSITFYSGVRMTAVGSDVSDNDKLIPYKIYGIK